MKDYLSLNIGIYHNFYDGVTESAFWVLESAPSLVLRFR